MATARCWSKRGVDLILKGVDAEQGEIGIDVGEDAANLRLEAFGSAVHLENGAFDVVGFVVDGLHHAGFVIVDVLGEGDEEEGARGAGAGGIGIARVADDADDLKGAGVAGEIEAEELADGVFAGLKELLDEGLIDDDDVLGGGGVVLGDGAAADDRLAEGFEIAGGNVIPGGAGVLVGAGHAVALADDHLAPVIGEGRVLGEGGAFDAGDMAEAVLEIAVQGV